MKKLRFVLYLSLALLVFSCSKDKDKTPEPQTPVHHFTFKNGNFWNFDNTIKIQGMPDITGTEKLTAKNVSGSSSEFDTEVSSNPLGVGGFFTGSLSQGTLKQDGSKLIFNGNLLVYKLEQDDADPIKLTIPVENVVVYDEDAAAGAELYNKADHVEQDFNIVVEGTMAIDYKLTVKQLGKGASLTAAGKSFTDVISSEITLSDVSIEFSSDLLPAPIELMQEDQTATFTSTVYFGEDFGLVKTEESVAIPFKTIHDIILEATGQDMSSEQIEASGAPDLQPIQFTLNQDLKDFQVN